MKRIITISIFVGSLAIGSLSAMTAYLPAVAGYAIGGHAVAENIQKPGHGSVAVAEAISRPGYGSVSLDGYAIGG
ncbi:MAG TPA: hypothetical protein VFT66_12545 [Roseiflexaceae bacterium]|jgi:hypothetical protein|nr:hypothetical protein [Roseiflexaceae bacterium]